MYYTSRYKETYKMSKPTRQSTYEMTTQDEAEARRMSYAFRKIRDNQEAKDQAEYQAEQARGYCPHCHILLPLNGECDCGYVKPKAKSLDISTDFQSRLNNLKAGFAK